MHNHHEATEKVDTSGKEKTSDVSWTSLVSYKGILKIHGYAHQAGIAEVLSLYAVCTLPCYNGKYTGLVATNQ